ncbi:MAG: hypothetical protein M3237_14725 [Actinomycetota bacterium]|nr:hypothetical protein [Actinomycetota bacterium]
MNSTTRRALPAVLLTAIVLAVAFAGGATAAKLITGKNIKNNTVTTQDIKNKSLKSPDVKDGSLSEVDLNGSVKSKLNAPSVKGYEIKSVTQEVPVDGEVTLVVGCSPGKVALSGGGMWEDITDVTAIKESTPGKVLGEDQLFAPVDGNYANGWRIVGGHNSLEVRDLTAYVICVHPN